MDNMPRGSTGLKPWRSNYSAKIRLILASAGLYPITTTLPTTEFSLRRSLARARNLGRRSPRIRPLPTSIKRQQRIPRLWPVRWRVSLSSHIRRGRGGHAGGNGVHDGATAAGAGIKRRREELRKAGRGVYRDRPDGSTSTSAAACLLELPATRPAPSRGIVRDARRIS